MRGQQRFTPNNANRSRKGSTNKSKSPSRNTSELGEAMLQLAWVEKSFQAGLSGDQIIQSYFLTEKERILNQEQRRTFIEEQIRKMIRERKNKDKKILNMVEHISENIYKVPLRLDNTWTKYTDLGYPLVVDANLIVTKDKQGWTDFFKTFFKNDLIKTPNQNWPEINNYNQQQQNEIMTYYTRDQINLMTQDEDATDIVDRLQRNIKGRIVIHKEYMFPDKEPWIIEREGFTHHIYLGADGTPNRLICNRKEMYQLLGDYYKIRDRQRIYMVKYSFKEYLVKLQQVQDHIGGGQQINQGMGADNRIQQGQRIEHQSMQQLQSSRQTEVIQEEESSFIRSNLQIEEARMKEERERAINEIAEQIYQQQQQQIRMQGVEQEVKEITPIEYYRVSRGNEKVKSSERNNSRTEQKELERSGRKERQASKVKETGISQEQRVQEKRLIEDMVRVKPLMICEPMEDKQLQHEDGTYRVLFDIQEYQIMEEAHAKSLMRGEMIFNKDVYTFEDTPLNDNSRIVKTPIAVKWRGSVLDFSQIMGKYAGREHPIKKQLIEDIAMVWFVDRIIKNRQDKGLDQDEKKTVQYLRERYGTDTWALWLMKTEETMVEKLKQEKWKNQMGIRILDESAIQLLVKQHEKQISDKGSGGYLYKEANAFFVMSNITLYAWRKVGEEEFEFKFAVWQMKTRNELKKMSVVIEGSVVKFEEFLKTFNLHPWCNMIAQPNYDWAVVDRISREIFPSLLCLGTLVTRVEGSEGRYGFAKHTPIKYMLREWSTEDQQLVQKYKTVQHYNGN